MKWKVNYDILNHNYEIQSHNYDILSHNYHKKSKLWDTRS